MATSSISGRRPPEWAIDAACTGLAVRELDPWHDLDRLGAVERAKAVCATCPVQDPCREDGLGLLKLVAVVGIWGGLLPSELKELARERGLPWMRVAPHGSRSRYVSSQWACRCRKCSEANTAYEFLRRRSALAGMPAPLARPAGSVRLRKLGVHGSGPGGLRRAA